MASRVPKNPDERPIDDYRPIKVICIGAGMNGIAVGALLPQHIPNLELTIYEKNPEVGGTWYENHYPGLRPDLTPHVYQYTFASNPNWTRFYPPGAEFEEYLKAVAAKFKVYDNTKFSHKFIKAEWFEEDGQWEVHVQRLSDNEIIVDRAEFLIKATGLVNEWQWPHIPGREKFKGTMLHTANWDDNFDPTGLKVAVLGYGSTGVQITPAIQPIVKQLDHYVRGKVWVPPGGGTNTEELIERGVENNFDHDLAERKYFSENPKAYLQFRRKQEAYCNNVQKIFFRDTEASVEFTKFLDSNLKESTRKKPWLYEALKPDYPPGCRRLIMGQIWLEKMQEPNANIISRDVVEFTEKGLIDSEGVETEYDAIICATGFDASLQTAAGSFIGRNGVTLQQAWDPDPIAYMGVQPPNMPNMFCLFGPNSAPFAGSIVHTFESCTHYIIKCVKKMQQEYLKSLVCKQQAIDNWNKHVDRHMAKTVMTANCVTWFKRNKPEGRVIISWPGSAMHGNFSHENPRFEDFEYTSWLPEDDTMAWIGNGRTVAEFTAIVGHELGHFRGEDTAMSQQFYPIYRGTTAAIEGLAASGELASSGRVAP